LAGTATVLPEDDLLLDRVRQGDRAAAAALMQQHNRALWRIARSILGDDADAEEVVQETYLRGFRAIGTFRGDANLGTWLARIAVNEALRRLGRRRPAADAAGLDEADGSEQIAAATTANPEHIAARAEIRRMVERAIDALPPPFRAVFMMRVVEQMSIEETAAVLAIPAATVKTRLHRATRELRAALRADLAAVFADAFPFAGLRCEELTATVLARWTSPARPAPDGAPCNHNRR
jgi:RNA polymerase sigma-70 factor, ECF subfamily